MSSTSGEDRARSFHDDHIEPVARRLRERGVRFFPTGPDAEAESWYEAPHAGELFFALEAGDLERVLRKRWEDLPELAALAPHLAELASTYELETDESGDISPFVYVMY